MDLGFSLSQVEKVSLTHERERESGKGESKMQRERERQGCVWGGYTCDSAAQPRGGSRPHKTETARHRWVEKQLGGAPLPVKIISHVNNNFLYK